MADVLVDTDVFVDHLRGVRRLDPAGDRVHFSAITRAELFAGPSRQLEAVRTLLGPFVELAVGTTVAELGGRIKREAAIPLPDALIAATALSAGLALVSGNLRHFQRVRALAVRPPG